MDSSNVASGSTPPVNTVDLPSPTYSPSTSTFSSHASRLNSNTPSFPSSINLGLPQFQQRNTSVSSLMDAVMGPNSNHTSQQASSSSGISPQQQTSPAHYLPTPIALKPQSNPLTGSSNGTGIGRSGLGHGNGTGLARPESLGDWDILTDVTGKINEGVGHGKPQNDQAVKELQEKVDKRRSQLPHLENQLAELEAQIKAAEERLSRAGLSTGGSAK